MPPKHRKIAFSTKQKKEQLKAKRERKRNKNESSSDDDIENEELTTDESTLKLSDKVKAINYQPKNKTDPRDVNRFNLQFMKESSEELKRHKKNASKELVIKNETELEIDIESVFKSSSPLDMPIRPEWSFDMTKEQLEQQERNYFQKYLETIFDSFKLNELSYFEFNLETWRQLWRVLEISDIILLIVDIRFPPLHFSPKFYEYCSKKLKKDVILVLNKIDLVPSSVVIAWKSYFETKYPNLHILLFSSAKQIKQKGNVKSSNKKGDQQASDDKQTALKAMSAEIFTAKAHRQLYECIKNIVKTNVDLTSWSNLTESRLKTTTSNLKEQTTQTYNTDNLDLTNEETNQMDELFNSTQERKKFEHGFLTIGCCGFPNVGKSSLLNSLNGRKVVSVSRTPGHTKHLQTIFLTKSVRLCDCPGLVFPSLVEKPLQVLAGIYPIAQLQEPYSAIRYLAERIPMIDILKIKHPGYKESKPGDDDFFKEITEWSPLDICEAWALKRGYFTAKASRPDAYRAANELLRMALDGKLCISIKPKNYYQEKEYWTTHPETKKLDDIVKNVELTAIQNLNLNPNELYDNKTDPIDDLDVYEEEGQDFHENSQTSEGDKSDLSQDEYHIQQTSNAFSALLKEDSNN